jgi:hypothetical protein
VADLGRSAKQNIPMKTLFGLVLGLMLASVLGYAGPELIQRSYASRDGTVEAAQDLKNKCARYCIYGRSAGLVYLQNWSDIAEKRFGIKVEAIAGCMVGDDLVKYAEDYNKVILEHVSKQYGPTAWRDCREEADANYQRRKSEDR